MSHLTAEELAELSQLINERSEEFEVGMGRISLGTLRQTIDIYHEWLEQTSSPRPWPAAPDPIEGDPMLDGYSIGYKHGYAEAERVLAIPVADNPEGDPPPMNHAVPDLHAAGKAAKAAIEAVAARVMVAREERDEKSTAADAPPNNAEKYSEPPPKSVEAVAMPKPRTLAEVDEELARRKAELDAIVGELQAMAVDGEMPTVMAWEDERGAASLSWKSIARRHGLSWADLARKAGLNYSRQGSLEPEAKELRRQAAEHDASRTVTYEEFLAEIKRIAMGKIMPTQAAFNDTKPAVWPTASALVMKFHTSWEELAEVVGLQYARGRKSVPASA